LQREKKNGTAGKESAAGDEMIYIEMKRKYVDLPAVKCH
jgi:hypothetical protein